MTTLDPGWRAEAEAEAVRVMVDALVVALARYAYLPVSLVPRSPLEAAARVQLAALRDLAGATLRAALLGDPP